MPRIKTDDLLPGMLVGRDVKTFDGLLIVPNGCELTERQIGILQAWGVTEIDIQDAGQDSGPVDPLAQLPKDVAARLTAEVKDRFWRLDEKSPEQMDIFRLVLNRKARQLAAAQQRSSP